MPASPVDPVLLAKILDFWKLLIFVTKNFLSLISFYVLKKKLFRDACFFVEFRKRLLCRHLLVVTSVYWKYSKPQVNVFQKIF